MYEMELINTTGVPVTLYTIYGTAWVLQPNPAYTITLEHEVVRHTTHFYRVAPLSVTTDRWSALTLPPIVANRHYLVTAHVACLYPGRKDFFIVGPVRRSETSALMFAGLVSWVRRRPFRPPRR